ncbi:FadR/GntR family transcriptional regulator [Novosphingobium ovatum]|uniref:FadR/GntR family transcriptional regulator n=1 Tax=Novosphingobium ovatum TaxID=1908523 RepID=UPI001D1141E3|nr:FadR/GntR family transcriptional regulator [Novosphingobium ovatum]
MHQSIAQDIGTRILQKQLLPGQSLGGEVDASERMGVSRTAYREAIRILIAKGMVESKPKAGTHVLPRRSWNLLDPDVLRWAFSDGPDLSLVVHLFELRAVVEPEAAALAAERRTPAHIEAMTNALEGMRKFGLAHAAGQAADQEFHLAILDATGNDPLCTLGVSVGAAVRLTTEFKQKLSANPRDPMREHEAVYDAIVAGDVEAARAAMRYLLRQARLDTSRDAPLNVL